MVSCFHVGVSFVEVRGGLMHEVRDGGQGWRSRSGPPSGILFPSAVHILYIYRLGNLNASLFSGAIKTFSRAIAPFSC